MNSLPLHLTLAFRVFLISTCSPGSLLAQFWLKECGFYLSRDVSSDSSILAVSARQKFREVGGPKQRYGTHRIGTPAVTRVTAEKRRAGATLAHRQLTTPSPGAPETKTPFTAPVLWRGAVNLSAAVTHQPRRLLPHLERGAAAVRGRGGGAPGAVRCRSAPPAVGKLAARPRRPPRPPRAHRRCGASCSSAPRG